MAVFGAPTAFGDDAERAVRAALAVGDGVAGELRLRVAVNTGEALVSLGAEPHLGELMVAGDVVNTASRLQQAAPENGVLVGEETYRATRDAIEYPPEDPVVGKGKAEALRTWVAVRARAAAGERSHSSMFVGRTRELAILRGIWERVTDERTPHLVTIVGEAGAARRGSRSSSRGSRTGSAGSACAAAPFDTATRARTARSPRSGRPSMRRRSRRLPPAIRSSSSSWRRRSPSRAAAQPRCRRRSRACSLRDSTSCRPPSARCCSRPRSSGRCSGAGRSPGWRRTVPRSRRCSEPSSAAIRPPGDGLGDRGRPAVHVHARPRPGRRIRAAAARAQQYLHVRDARQLIGESES